MTRTLAALAFAWALLLPMAQAAAQDPATYPAGVLSVSNTPALPGADFEVAVEVDGSADSVGVYVCSFPSPEAAKPDLCYMPLGASRSGTRWTASTSAVEHPEWRDGAVLGYKVLVRGPGGDLHAPDRLTSDGERDYYRLVVGAADVEGTAVVEDDVAAEPLASAPTADAPAGVWPLALGLGLAFLRRRA